MSLVQFVAQIFNLIYIVLLVFILLSWVPNVDWGRQPFYGIRVFSEFFFAPFRKIIPPIGGMLDISPIICFIVLQIIERGILIILVNLGF